MVILGCGYGECIGTGNPVTRFYVCSRQYRGS